MSIPPLLLLIFIVALLGPGIWTVIAVIGVVSAIRNSRIIRGSTLEVMSLDYMDAARIIGASWPRIAFRYILPNIMAPVIVLFSLGLGAAILVESSLSFLGYGVPPPAPTWGQMLGLDAQRFFFVAPWLAIAPGVALTIVVFAINIFGDALRDRLDPRQRGT
jgi:peptide/nickel transport system permease protein